MADCAKCGAKLEKDARFCGACGSKVNDKQENERYMMAEFINAPIAGQY